jgi:drug/metabolite transporter (DMT)-like permease
MNKKLPARKVSNKDRDLMLAYAALFIANMLWAAAGPVIKITTSSIPVFTLLLFRFLLVCILLLPFIILEVRKNSVNKSDYFNLFMLGLFSQTGIFFIFYAFKYTSVLDATIIGILGMLGSVAAGHYFYKEKVNRGLLIGLFIASLGTLFVVVEPLIISSGHFTPDVKSRMFGNFFAVLYNVAFLLYIIWSKMSMGQNSKPLKKTLSFIHLKPMKGSYSPFLLSGTSFFVGLATFIPLALAENSGLFGETFFRPGDLTTSNVLGILFLSLLSSIAAYMLFQWALAHANVGDSAIFGYLQPVLTLPFAYLMLSEVPTVYSITGSAVIAVGVVIAELSKS